MEFTATATAGAPKATFAASGDTTVFVGETTLPLVVSVIDTGGNPVAGRIVTFETSGAPSGARGYRLSAVRDTSDAQGRVSTMLTAGDKAGRYTVLATLDDLPSSAFVIRALDVKGNPNLDERIDIADLTTIIDHILGRSILSGPALAGADVDSNGVVDIFDALITQNYILSGGSWIIGDSTLTAPGEYASLSVHRGVEESGEQVRKATEDSAPAGGSPLNTVAMLEFTKLGVRVNLENDVPVKGVQVYLRLKRPVPRPSGDIKFARAAHMRVIVAGSGNEIFAVAYNFTNTPIDTGSGAIFRLPLAGLDTTDVDSVAIIVSSGPTNVSTQVDQQKVSLTPLAVPTSFALYQNYPNPFNAQTTILYDIPELNGRIARVTIQIYNLVGEKVMTIDRGERDAGTYKILWDGRDQYGQNLATGVYFYRLISLDTDNKALFTSTKKMLYLK